MIYDPSVSYDVITNDIPSVPFVDYWSGLFSFNETFVDHLHEKWESCGYADFYEEAFTFPPKGPLPTPPNVGNNVTDCSLWVSFSMYQTSWFHRSNIDPHLERDLLRCTIGQPLLGCLPGCYDVSSAMGRARLPWQLRLPPGRRLRLLQPYRSPEGHQRSSPGMGRVQQRRA